MSDSLKRAGVRRRAASSPWDGLDDHVGTSFLVTTAPGKSNKKSENMDVSPVPATFLLVKDFRPGPETVGFWLGLGVSGRNASPQQKSSSLQ